tara:strand:+ start:108 stop:899 length:792 start_codon:yes stop_codon:yes gene_type:complete
MWKYIKSFISNPIDEKTPEILTSRQKSMILRHQISEKIEHNSLKLTNGGWSQGALPHTDWTCKLENSICLPFIESDKALTKVVSAKLIPIYNEGKLLTLQYYLENFSQFNKNIHINYNLASCAIEPVVLRCNVVVIPKTADIKHNPVKLTHRYDPCNGNMLVISNKTNSISLLENSRKQIIDFEQNNKDLEKTHFNVCVQIPVKKTPINRGIYIRDTTRNIKATVLYYLYIDHDEVEESDVHKIKEIIDNFKKDSFLVSKNSV